MLLTRTVRSISCRDDIDRATELQFDNGGKNKLERVVTILQLVFLDVPTSKGLAMHVAGVLFVPKTRKDGIGPLKSAWGRFFRAQWDTGGDRYNERSGTVSLTRDVLPPSTKEYIFEFF
jgi:hypothetical protein